MKNFFLPVHFNSLRSLVVTVLAGLVVSLSPDVAIAQNLPPFEMLVVGDSHISGQGLRQENKFYFLVKEWLQSEVFRTSRKVNLKVKAHGGSRITLHPGELAAMQKSGDDVNKFHYAEANISSPSIMTQIDVARKEYDTGEMVNLVMLSGCITDVLVSDLINPFYPEKKMRERVKRFCGESMSGLLEHATKTFPNAYVVVVGYFPIASSESDVTTMARYFLRIVSFPPKLQFIFTNPFGKLFLRILRGKIAKRSRIWVRESNREMQQAIAKINGRERPKVFFVESPIMEEHSYATKKSLLWEIGKNHAPDDETYADRLAGCAKVFGEMKYKHYGRLSRRMCEISSVAHPNVAGSKAYADAIKKSLESNLSVTDQKVGNL